MYTLDFETYYDAKHSLTRMATYEYAASEKTEVIGVGFKNHTTGESRYIPTPTAEDLAFLAEETVIAHNAQFDGLILYKKFGITPKKWYCTRAMATALFPHESASLKSLAMNLWPENPEMRKGTELINSLGKHSHELDMPAMAKYCLQDVALTAAAFELMRDDFGFPQRELDIIDMTVRMYTDPVLEIDSELAQRIIDDDKKERQDHLAALGVTSTQLNSNQQFLALLGDEVEVPLKESPTTGKQIPSLGKNDPALKAWLPQQPERTRELFNARFSLKSNLLTTRCIKLLDIASSYGVLPVPLTYGGAKYTLRHSGFDKINLQNLPKGAIRNVLRAPKGHKLIIADSSQIECRVLAYLANNEKLLEVFRDGEDPYAHMASLVFKRPITKEENPVERNKGKALLLGAGYSMGAQRFSDFADIPLGEASMLIKDYRNANIETVKLWEACDTVLHKALAEQTRATSAFITTKPSQSRVDENHLHPLLPFSHEYGQGLNHKLTIEFPESTPLVYRDLREHFDPRTDSVQMDYHRDYKVRAKIHRGLFTENLVQKLARNIVMQQAVDLQKLGYKVALMVHDEIILSVPEGQAEQAFEDAIRVMSTAPSYIPDLPLGAEGGIHEFYTK